ncbi:unnamed protein product [Citrullus colocynthis]|uniref:Uncharacterized protein n=1 Tax=Citrullus colocynthis TaxID=252529 RepID=A0ABP0Y556_9ROSI
MLLHPGEKDNDDDDVYRARFQTTVQFQQLVFSKDMKNTKDLKVKQCDLLILLV